MQDEILSSVQLFLYREARLLDDRQFRQWLDLLDEDLLYRMVSRRFRYPSASKAMAEKYRERDREWEGSRENELSIMEETKHSLVLRVERLETGMAWAEDPPSATRRIISNVEVEQGERESPGGRFLQLHALSHPRGRRTRSVRRRPGGCAAQGER